MTKMIVLITALIGLNAQALPKETVNNFSCAAKTRTGTESLFHLVASQDGKPISATFSFHLRSGKTNVVKYSANSLTGLKVEPGKSGEMMAQILIDSKDSKLAINYEGNDFLSRIDTKATDPNDGLMDLYNHLSAKGDFGHISYDKSVDPKKLGGTVDGYTKWHGKKVKIHFNEVICMTYKSQI